MDVKIIETGKIETLEIIDPKTGVNWINDLMGSYDSLPHHDDDACAYVMSQSDYNWWSDLTANKQAADDRAHKIRSDLSNEQQAEFDAAMMGDDWPNDLDAEPGHVNSICDRFDADFIDD